MSASDSVSEWILQVKQGDAEAANMLWERYFNKIRQRARHLLRATSTRVSDEEDVAASVFESLYKGAIDGRFSELSTRDDLWFLLLAMTKRKAISQCRYNGRVKRGGDVYVRGETELGTVGAPFDLAALVRDEPTPDFMVEMKDQLEYLLSSLRDESLRNVVRWRLERNTTRDIAHKLGITNRAVERKLSLIRSKWFRRIFNE